jgi:hypothetical protein
MVPPVKSTPKFNPGTSKNRAERATMTPEKIKTGFLY